MGPVREVAEVWKGEGWGGRGLSAPVPPRSSACARASPFRVRVSKPLQSLRARVEPRLSVCAGRGAAARPDRVRVRPFYRRRPRKADSARRSRDDDASGADGRALDSRGRAEIVFFHPCFLPARLTAESPPDPTSPPAPQDASILTLDRGGCRNGTERKGTTRHSE